MRENFENKKIRAQKIYGLLHNNYLDVPELFLDYITDAQMLCAIILSAQSTDAQVNRVTSKLFKKYKTVSDFAHADRKQFEKEIFSTGFYKSKTKKVISCFQKVIREHKGKIPETMSALIELPGVGRKTANLYLVSKGIIDGIAVDTHVGRLSQRFGFSVYKDANKIEQDLMLLYPKTKWHKVNGLFISHGRTICTARKPNCNKCFLNKVKLCPKIGVVLSK